LAVQQFVASLNFGPDWRRREPFEVVAFLPDSEGVGKFFEPFPIVVWGGGLALGQGNYEPAARLAASHGVAMIVAIFFDDLLDLLSDEEGAWASERIIDWIDEQASGPWAGRVAADSLGVGGHSGGGKVAMWTAIRDPRVLAAFVIDPVDRSDFSPDDFEAYPSVTPELMDLFGIPGGFVGGGLSSRRSAFGPCVPPDENYHEFFRCAGSPAFEYFLPEAGHLDFAYGAGIRGLACPAGRRPARSRSLAYGTMVAFFRLFLANDDRYRPWVDGDALLAQPDVVFASH
jgi:hypothetical protein